VTANNPVPMPNQPAEKNFAQACLENQSGHAIVVKTSWVGETTRSVLPNGGQHIFRFEDTGVIADGEETKTLAIEYKPRGLMGPFQQTAIDTPRTYVESNNCDELSVWVFVYVQDGLGNEHLVLTPSL
jgi:hypothetical protein